MLIFQWEYHNRIQDIQLIISKYWKTSVICAPRGKHHFFDIFGDFKDFLMFF